MSRYPWIRSRIRRPHRGTAIIAALGLSLTACGGTSAGPNTAVSGSWADIVAAAEQEGAVTIYSTQVPDQLESLKASFERKYPKIKLTIARSEDTELIPRVEAEHRTSQGIGDVYVTASLPWITEHTDLFQAPRGPSFEAPEYNKSTNVAAGNYFVVSAFITAFAWNTNLFPGTLRDWSDLLDPRLGNGNIGVVNPDTATKVGFFKYLEENFGTDFLNKLAAQRPKIYPSAVPMAAALTSGEISAATFVTPMNKEKAAGAPVEWAVGQKPVGVPWYGIVLGTAPHPNAAQVLADFIISREGQDSVTANAAAVLDGAPRAVAKMADVSKLDLTKLTPDQVRDFQADWEKLFVS